MDLLRRPCGPGARSPRSGSGLALAVVMILVLAALAAAIVSMTSAGYLEKRHARDEMRAFYAAEAGLNEASATLLLRGREALEDLAYPRELGSAVYEVESTFGRDDPDLDFDRIRLECTASEGREASRVVAYLRMVPNGDYTHALFGDEGVRLRSNAYVDSYDSSRGEYPGEGLSGDAGHVGSNADITIYSNVEVHGDVTVGPDGTLEDEAPGTYVSGSVEPAETLVDMPAVAVPALPSLGNRSVPGDLTLPPGSYRFDALRVQGGGALRLVGPTTLVVDDLTLFSNGEIALDTTLGPIEIYSTGSFDLQSNSTLVTDNLRAADVAIFLTADNVADPSAKIGLNSNSRFVGTIYAPHARLAIESNFEVFGAVKAREVTLRSNARVHFDETLLFDEDEPIVYEHVSWQVHSGADA